MEAGLVGLGRPEVLLPVDGRERVGTNCGKIECVVLFFVDFANEDAVDEGKCSSQQTGKHDTRR